MTSEEVNDICNKHRASYGLPPRPEGIYDCLMTCEVKSDCPLILDAADYNTSYN